MTISLNNQVVHVLLCPPGHGGYSNKYGCEKMNRRDFLKISALTDSAAVIATRIGGYYSIQSDTIQSNVRIVIVGAGTGGLTTAAKLMNRIKGAKITIIDKNEKHQYQPGYTLIGCGVYQPKDVIKKNADYIPHGVTWRKTMVAEYDPDANIVITDTRDRIQYDFLIIASGIQQNFSAIKGMDVSLIGQNGIGSIYHGPKSALSTWHEVQKFKKKGGVGLFTKPATPIKCGGAPLKVAFLTESHAASTARRSDFEFHYLTGKKNLFKVPEIDKLCQERVKTKNIRPYCSHTLKAIDPNSKFAYFKTKETLKKFPYDFIHIVPPMSAPDNIKNSPLSWKSGKLAAGGWLCVDQFTLQHKKYTNVFGVGDVVGTPIGKTGASVKLQAPVVANNIVDLIKGYKPSHHFNGYTSCMLATGIGSAAIVEFDYKLQLCPTLPFCDPKNDNKLGWYMKVYAIKPMYFQMIQGRIPT